MPTDYLIGVDAGGTKTLAWLCPTDFQVGDTPLGIGQSGAGNPRAVGFELALERVGQAIDLAFHMAGINKQCVTGICICMAGAGRPDEQERVRNWCFTQGIAAKAHVSGDAEPVLAAASQDLTGIALISGTGSFCWGRNKAGKTARAGGWGYLFGDEGSAYRIALEGLRAATQSVDGIVPETLLLPELMTALQIDQPEQIVETIYGNNLNREQIARLAHCVFAVGNRDAVAAAIIDHAAAELSQMVQCVGSKLGLIDGEYRLGLTGGILVHQAAFRQDVILRVGLPVEDVVVIETPVAGAVLLAGQDR